MVIMCVVVPFIVVLGTSSKLEIVSWPGVILYPGHCIIHCPLNPQGEFMTCVPDPVVLIRRVVYSLIITLDPLGLTTTEGR